MGCDGPGSQFLHRRQGIGSLMLRWILSCSMSWARGGGCYVNPQSLLRVLCGNYSRGPRSAYKMIGSCVLFCLWNAGIGGGFGAAVQGLELLE